MIKRMKPNLVENFNVYQGEGSQQNMNVKKKVLISFKKKLHKDICPVNIYKTINPIYLEKEEVKRDV